MRIEDYRRLDLNDVVRYQGDLYYVARFYKTRDQALLLPVEGGAPVGPIPYRELELVPESNPLTFNRPPAQRARGVEPVELREPQ